MINPAENIRDFYTCLVVTTSDCDSALELGCGFGDKLACIKAAMRVGVDVHKPYLDVAKLKWKDRIYFVWQDALEYAFNCVDQFDAVLLIDFIEHLHKGDALKLLHKCQGIVRRRIIVFTPEGESVQNRDVYEMGGDQVQTHRSYWQAEELKEIGFRVAIWEEFHVNKCGALFAIWEP